MKKFNLLVLAMLITISSYCQSFMDVPVDGKLSEAVAKFKAKGFVVDQSNGASSDTYVSMRGKMGSTTIELNLVATPTTHTVWKYVVYLPKNDSWYSIKNEFYEYRKTLVSKYGLPSKDYSFFSSPYYEGDGYEMSALTLGKCSYYSFWDELSISISKFKQVCISYESKANSKLDDEESEKLKSKSF